MRNEPTARIGILYGRGRSARRAILLALWAAFALAAAPLPTTFGQTLTLNLTDTPQQGTPGGSPLIFSGILTNTGSAPITIDGSSFVFLPSLAGLDANDSADFISFVVGGGTLDPGQSYSGTLFDISVGTGVPGGSSADCTATYSGTCADPTTGDPTPAFASADFGVTVTAATAAAPEPATGCLLGAGLLVTTGRLIRRRKRRGYVAAKSDTGSR